MRPTATPGVSRRGILRATGAGVLGAAGGSAASSAATRSRRQGVEPGVTFEDQYSEGSSVEIAEVRADVRANLYVHDARRDQVGTYGAELEAGETVADLTIQLDDSLEESQLLQASLLATDGRPLAADSAFVSVDVDEEIVEGLDVTLVPADPERGFNYPYYLFAPSRPPGPRRPILANPNNTGGATDDFEIHRRFAERVAHVGLGRMITDQLYLPLLVPVFPRPESDPVDATHYVHALDSDTMQLSEGDLERVDLQLLAMVEHAKATLADEGYHVDDDVVLNGFSASGNFVNRFAALHPESVRAVTAGAINGTAILPLEEAEGYTLDYHIGVADFESLIGEPFDREAWVEVEQFCYMGAEDENDTVPGDGAFDEEESEIALAVYGEDMQADRMPYCESVYEEAGAAARFQIYEGVGHGISPEIVSDLVEFHREQLSDSGPRVDEETSDVGEADGDDGLPGPGIGGALASLGGASFLLRRRLGAERERRD